MKLTLNILKKNFDLKVLSGEDKLETPIRVYGINRAGLELAGYFETGNRNKRLVLMSSKEYNYIMGLPKEERIKRYEILLTSAIPGVILTKKFKDSLIIDVAKKLDFPILQTFAESTSEFTQVVLEVFDDYFAPKDELHGSMVNIYGKGVLIIGESGIGKSEVTIELIKKNHMFVGDDRIIVTRKGLNIVTKSHEILKNLVEVRGIGIIDLSKASGYQSLLDESKLDLIIELKMFEKNEDSYDRLGVEYQNRKILNLDIPFLQIPVSQGRNLANIIETAVAQLKIKQANAVGDITKVISQRVKRYNEDQNE